MTELHRLLQRQLRKAVRADGSTDLDKLFELVSLAYSDQDKSRRLQERATDLMSQELQMLNDALRIERDEAVSLNTNRFMMALKTSNDGIWDWNPTTNAFWMSENCVEMLGFPAPPEDTLTFDTWYDLIWADDLAAAKEFIKASLTSSLSRNKTIRFRHADGSFRHILCRTSTVRDEAGNVSRVIGVQTNVTSLLAIQNELKVALVRAEAANEAKGDFLANMSHEIRTPMNGILGMAGLLKDTRLSVEQRNWVNIIARSGENLLDIINDILNFSKIEAGKVSLEPIHFDIYELVSEITNMLSLRAQEKGVALIVGFTPDVPRYVFGDPTRLRQILTNLIGNALKFTENGHVLINVGNVSGAESGAGDRIKLHFSIKDTGIGIAPEKIRHIFDKFSQAEESTTRRFGGTGLGLAISKTLVQMMGGRIDVESRLGVGSTFMFDLALQRGQPVGKSGPLPEADLGGHRVLFVGARYAGYDIMERYVEHWGMALDQAESVTQAVEKMKAAKQAGHPYLAVLTDQGPDPADDNHELLRQIRENGLADLTAALLLIAHAQDGISGSSLQKAGFTGLISKPVFPHHVRAVLQLVQTSRANLAQLPFVTYGALESRLKSPENEAALGANAFAGKRALIVEDVRVNLILLSRLLEKVGLTIVSAANGREAVDKVATADYDIIFMDCQMPEMDGFEATREIRKLENPDEPRIPIIALTADAMVGDREKCIQAGMDDYLNKPLRVEKLADVLKKWLQNTPPDTL